MGRQLNFWMTESDEQAFVDRLRKDDAVWTPRNLAYRERPQLCEFEDWPASATGETFIIIRRHEWDQLRFEHIRSKPPYESWTMVGTGSSPCFEFDTCKRGPDFISRGRIYFKSDWLAGNEVLVKPEEPTRWFDRLVAWLRRQGIKGKYKREYIMSDAEKARSHGDVELNRND